MMTREFAANFKKICEETECEKCPFSVGIYMEGLDYVYYSCDLRKKPRDYNIEKERMKQTKTSKKERMKQTKTSKKDEEKAEKKAKRDKRAADLEAKCDVKKNDNKTEKKKRGRPKKSESMVKDTEGKNILF